MASKGLRVIFYQATRKVEAGYKPSHTTETLIGYTACYRAFFYPFVVHRQVTFFKNFSNEVQ